MRGGQNRDDQGHRHPDSCQHISRAPPLTPDRNSLKGARSREKNIGGYPTDSVREMTTIRRDQASSVSHGRPSDRGSTGQFMDDRFCGCLAQRSRSRWPRSADRSAGRPTDRAGHVQRANSRFSSRRQGFWAVEQRSSGTSARDEGHECIGLSTGHGRQFSFRAIDRSLPAPAPIPRSTWRTACGTFPRRPDRQRRGVPPCRSC